jgi:hypothetical protein
MIVNQDAANYIKQIRNITKRTYAQTFHGWMLGGCRTVEPRRPDGLSHMAAQAVRLTLISFYQTH